MTKRTIWDNDEAASNERERRRFAAEARQVAKWEREDRETAKLERLAAPKIGQLCREGKTIHYINLLPLTAGKTMEGTEEQLTAFLVKNCAKYL